LTYHKKPMDPEETARCFINPTKNLFNLALNQGCKTMPKVQRIVELAVEAVLFTDIVSGEQDLAMICLRFALCLE